VAKPPPPPPPPPPPIRSPKGMPRLNLRGCRTEEVANLFSLSTLNHFHMLVMEPANLLQHTHTHHSFGFRTKVTEYQNIRTKGLF